MKKEYEHNKKAKVGDNCTCPSCGTLFVKEAYNQVFCKAKGGTICKDKYWNTITPEKRCNITRISPANSRWMEKESERRDHLRIAADDGLDYLLERGCSSPD